MSADGYMHPAPADTLPANSEAEQALLGCVLFDNAAHERVADITRPEHFREPFHGRLWDRIATLIGKGTLADPILLSQHFNEDPAYEELGGIRYLADLVDRAPPPFTAPDFAREIQDLAQRRALISISGEIATAARKDHDTSAADQIEEAEQALFSIAENGAAKTGPVSFDFALTKALAQARAAFERDGHLSGLATGLHDLDRKTGGLHPSDLIIIAARPSMGKSALAANIAFNVAKHYAWEPDGADGRRTINGGQVLLFSLEMAEEQLAMRILAEVSGIPSDKIRRGDIRTDEFGRIRDAAALINEIPLSIDATGGISLSQLVTRARRMKRRQGLDLIIVDYLQLVTADRRGRSDNRTNEVGEISQGLKALAKELQVPVIACAQLSRKVEDRDDKRPQLADLRESGSIEQDADVVISIYREAYYLARQEPKAGTSEHDRWVTEMEVARHGAELIIGKQRHGPIGTVKVAYDEDTTRFSNRAREGEYGQARMQYPED